MRKNCFFVAIIVSLFVLARAQHTWAEDLFSETNRLYTENQFEDAAKKYEQILSNEGFSPSLLYNLGNSYYQLHQLGRAVLAYRQALLLDPSDPDIEANLNLTLKDLGVYTDSRPVWQNIFFYLSLNQWLMLCIASLLVVVIYLLINLFPLISYGEKFQLELMRYMKIIKNLAFIMLTFSVIAIYFQTNSIPDFIVIQKDAPLLVSPFDSAARTAALREGTSLSKESEHEGYFLVRDKANSSLSGWVKKADIKAVLP